MYEVKMMPLSEERLIAPDLAFFYWLSCIAQFPICV